MILTRATKHAYHPWLSTFARSRHAGHPVTDTASEPGFDLDAAEIRVLGVLIEKSFITPDTYPMSVNAIVTGCNQLTAREPVMSLSESEVQSAIDSLIGRRLVAKRDQPSARVAKYEHLVRLRHSLPPPSRPCWPC